MTFNAFHNRKTKPRREQTRCFILQLFKKNIYIYVNTPIFNTGCFIFAKKKIYIYNWSVKHPNGQLFVRLDTQHDNTFKTIHPGVLAPTKPSKKLRFGHAPAAHIQPLVCQHLLSATVGN